MKYIKKYENQGWLFNIGSEQELSNDFERKKYSEFLFKLGEDVKEKKSGKWGTITRVAYNGDHLYKINGFLWCKESELTNQEMIDVEKYNL